MVVELKEFMAIVAERGEIMKQKVTGYIGVTLVSLATAACSPSNETVGKNVKEKLIADPLVKAAQIDIRVQKNVVTLTGTVDTPEVKEKAVAAARGARGVAEVVDQLTVNRRGPGPGHAAGAGHERMGSGVSEGMHHPGGEIRK